MIINPKFTVGKLNDFDVIERVKNMSKTERLMWGGGLGAAGGAVSAGFDDEDDSVGSLVKKMAVGAAIDIGIDIGAEHVLKNTEWGKKLTAGAVAQGGDTEKAKVLTERDRPRVDRTINETAEAEKLTEPDTTIKASDTAEADVKAEAEKAFKEAKSKKMKKVLKGGKVAGLVGLGAFAVATAMDSNESLAENRRTSRMTEEQEKNLKRKMSREEQEQKRYSYGYVGMGDIVGELFENRIGHYKMGNSKFQ